MEIEGVRLKVQPAELRTHLQGRVEYHIKAIAELKRQLAAFEEWEADVKKKGYARDMTEDDIVEYVSNFKGLNEQYGRSPAQGMKREIDRREKLIKVFTFIAEHLFEDNVYSLDTTDLSYLEFVK